MLAIGAIVQWSRYQKAMRLDEPFHQSSLIIGLALAVFLLWPWPLLYRCFGHEFAA